MVILILTNNFVVKICYKQIFKLLLSIFFKILNIFTSNFSIKFFKIILLHLLSKQLHMVILFNLLFLFQNDELLEILNTS